MTWFVQKERKKYVYIIRAVLSFTFLRVLTLKNGRGQNITIMSFRSSENRIKLYYNLYPKHIKSVRVRDVVFIIFNVHTRVFNSTTVFFVNGVRSV